jgi:H+/Cl- antiporter ClcA
MTTATRSPRRARAADPLLLVISVAMLGVALGVIAYIAKIVRDGAIDMRPKHAGGMEPFYLRAAEEPVWFYAIAAGLAVLAILSLTIGWRMLRQSLRPR